MQKNLGTRKIFLVFHAQLSDNYYIFTSDDNEISISESEDEDRNEDEKIVEASILPGPSNSEGNTFHKE